MSTKKAIKGGKAVIEAIAEMELPLSRIICAPFFDGKQEKDIRAINIYYYLFNRPLDILSKINESWSLFLFRNEEDFNKFFNSTCKFTLTHELPSLIKVAKIDENISKIPTAMIYIATFEENSNV